MRARALFSPHERLAGCRACASRCRHDYPHNPASLFAQWVDVALRIYAYSGNSSWVAKAEVMMAFQLANGTTANSSDWTWPGVPYASSDAGYTVYRGSHHGNVSGSSSGIEVLLDGVALPRRAGAIPGDFAGEFEGGSWSLDESTGVLEVARYDTTGAGGRVAVVTRAQ